MRNVIFVILCVSMMCSASDESTRKNFSSSFDKVLSRRKRYLIFPEGSSLQLVYCLTMPVIGKSTIFTIGGTAALAWELPHDPFQPYRKHAELLHRKDPPGEYIIKDTKWKQSRPQSGATYLGTVPARYQPTLLPRFPSIKYSPSYNRYRYHNHRRQGMPQRQQQIKLQASSAPVYYRQELPNYYPPTHSQRTIYHQVHRRTRRELYNKVEKFLSAQSKDGKACLLKVICETHQKGSEKGSFMEELMKAVFRVKPIDEHADEDVYDLAANKTHNCAKMFPTCDSSIFKFI